MQSTILDTPGLADALKRAVAMMQTRYLSALTTLDRPKDQWSGDLRHMVEQLLGVEDFDGRLETVLSMDVP